MSNNKENNKRKANTSSSSKTRIVVKPSKLEELRYRRNAIMVQADDTFQRLEQCQHDLPTKFASIVTNKLKEIEAVVQMFEAKASLLEQQAESDGKQLSVLKQTLEALNIAKNDHEKEMEALNQEQVRLRLEATQLEDESKETEASIETLRKNKKGLHSRTLNQIAFYEKVSGIVWNYAEIEANSDRLVGQVVR